MRFNSNVSKKAYIFDILAFSPGKLVYDISSQNPVLLILHTVWLAFGGLGKGAKRNQFGF